MVARAAAEAGEHDAVDLGRSGQQPVDRADGNACGAIGRETVDAGRYGGVGERAQVVGARERQARRVGTGEDLVLAGGTAAPDRPDRVDDVARLQPMAARDARLPWRTA